MNDYVKACTYGLITSIGLVGTITIFYYYPVITGIFLLFVVSSSFWYDYLNG